MKKILDYISVAFGYAFILGLAGFLLLSPALLAYNHGAPWYGILGGYVTIYLVFRGLDLIREV